MMKTIAFVRFMFCSVALVCGLRVSSLAQEVVVNGGFESGSFSPGWTLTDTDPSGPLSNIGSNPLFAHSGTFHANLGTAFPPDPPSMGTLSQTLATTPGLYTLSFWLAHDVDVAPSNSFQVLFNGVPIPTFTQTNAGAFDYMNFTITGLVATGPSTLQFQFQDSDDFFRLDDVSVTPVPEPSVTWLVLPSTAVLCFAYRRRAA